MEMKGKISLKQARYVNRSRNRAYEAVIRM
jgi:hypothetical protein